MVGDDRCSTGAATRGGRQGESNGSYIWGVDRERAQDLSATAGRDTRSIMEAWAREMLDIWEEKLSEIAEATLTDANRMWVAKYTTEDIAQMIRGAKVMMTEELEGRKSDLREDYFATVIPALASQGESVSKVAAVDMASCIRIATAVLPGISAEHRAKAAEFFVGWQARFLQDIILTAIESGAKP